MPLRIEITLILADYGILERNTFIRFRFSCIANAIPHENILRAGDLKFRFHLL